MSEDSEYDVGYARPPIGISVGSRSRSIFGGLSPPVSPRRKLVSPCTLLTTWAVPKSSVPPAPTRIREHKLNAA